MGSNTITLSSDSAHLKDDKGNFFSRNDQNQNLTKIPSFTSLDSQDNLRGEIAFKVDSKPKDNLMFIWDSNDAYINTGVLGGHKRNELVTTNQTKLLLS